MAKPRSKWNVVLMICLVFVLALTACGTNNTNTGEAPPPKDSNSSADPAPVVEENEPVTLKWVLLGPGKQQDAEKVWAEFNKRLETLLPNTTVDFTVLTNADFVEKWKLMSASGEPVDLAWTGYLVPFVPEVNKGAYMPLNDLIDKHAPNLKKSVPGWVLERSTINGELYAIPNYQFETGGIVSLKIPKDRGDKYLDFDKLEQVAMSTPTSTKEFYQPIEEYLKKLKDNNELGKGAGMTTLVPWFLDRGYEYFGSTSGIFGYSIDDSTFKVVNKFEIQAYKDAIDVAADWFKKGYIRKDILSVQEPRADDGKPDGTAVFAHAHGAKGVTVTPANDAGTSVDIYNIPLGDKHFIKSGDAATATAIPKTSKNPERALKLLELLNSDQGKDLYNLLIWGFEGEHYKQISPTRIETIGYTGQGILDAKYGLWKWTIVGNPSHSYETQLDPEGYFEYAKNVTETAKKSSLMAFKLDTTPITTELAQVSAVVKEYDKSLITGSLPDYQERYKEFIDKMKSAGSDKIMTEIQKQIDAFVKANNIK